MARIRTVKPEFFTSEQVMNLPISARLAFIGLWCFCDDAGNHTASAKTLKAEVFPSDDVTSTEVQGYVDHLLEQGLLVIYEAEGKQYWHVTGWHHQRIDKPTIKHPPFRAPAATAPVAVEAEESSPRVEGDDGSQIALGGLDEDSPSTTRGLDPGMEGKGKEGRNTPQPPKGGRRSKPAGSEHDPPGFAEFWAVYPRRDARQDAVKAFRQVGVHESPQLLQSVLAGVRAWSVHEQWVRDGGRYIPLPASWLRGRRWEDEALAVVLRAAGESPDGGPPWWQRAGFANQHEAANARCYAHNADQFRDGHRVEEAAA